MAQYNIQIKNGKDIIAEVTLDLKTLEYQAKLGDIEMPKSNAVTISDEQHMLRCKAATGSWADISLTKLDRPQFEKAHIDVPLKDGYSEIVHTRPNYSASASLIKAKN